jgi:acetyltransferase-like isoleucine patch superfamily enzyme
VNLAQKMLRKAVHIPACLVEILEQRSKLDKCVVGEAVQLYPECCISNFRNQKDAIAIGKQSHIRGELLVFAHGGSIRIGEECYIGEYSRIWSAISIMIGNRVLISHGVNIHDNNAHSLSAAARHIHFKQIISSGHPFILDDVPSAPIIIEDDAWIGYNSTILKGVTIGRGAVVGAASVVTKDVAAYEIVAGNPARVIGISRP